MRYKRIFLVLFVIVLFIPLFALLHNGLPVTDDGKDQVARIANFYTDLKYGIIVPRWAENLNWGYGHPILMFLYPLPSYIAGLFHTVGFSLVDSSKLVFALSFIASGIAMYLWLSAFLPFQAALTGSLIYVFAPYRFVDMYVRGDIGECLAFVFIPLILYFIYRLIKKRSGGLLLGLSVSTAGLILAHNAMALMFMPLVGLYLLYLFWRSGFNKKYLWTVCVFILVGFGLAAFFWVPALLEGKYTLRNIVLKGDVDSNFVSLQRLLYGPWGYGISSSFTLQAGILQWASVLVSIPVIFYLRKQKDKSWVFLFIVVIIFFITIFLMTKESSVIWDHISLLSSFQFPWRFLSVSVFLSAVAGACSFRLMSKILRNGALTGIFILALFLTIGDWHAQGYLQKPDSFYSGVYSGTTDTGESAPVWSVRFMEHRADARVDTISGRARIVQLARTPVYHRYQVNAKTNAVLRENTLYFPGWTIRVDGNGVPIQYQDPNSRGLMTFSVPQGMHIIVVQFSETKLRLISDYLSIFSVILLGALVFLKRKLWLV
jgi:hypothetical protein